MKRTLIALAAAAAGAASAQSSLTIYGIVDQGLNKMNNSGSHAVNPGAGTNGTTVLRAAWQNRLGFRGEEDLGGGNTAFFQLENRFNADDGSTLTPFFTGRSVVGAKSKAWGEFWVGRDYLPAFWPAVALDPWGWNTVGQMGSAYLWARYAGAEQLPRNNNTVNYKSPVIAGGLTFQLMHRLSEGSATVGKAFGTNVIYASGPVYLALAYDQADNQAAGPDARMMLVGAAYDFGVIRPRVSYTRSKAFTGAESKAYMLGLSAPAGSGRILAGYSRLNPDGPNNDASKFGIGYHYDLSRRTMLYVDFGSAKLDGQNRSRGFDLGIRHTF